MITSSIRHRVFAASACLVLVTAVACSTAESEPVDPNEGPPIAGGGSSSPPQPQTSEPGKATSNEEPDLGPTPVVQLIGRFDTSDAAGPKASWPGARIITRFRGTAVSVTFSEYAADWMEGAPSYWEARIDGGPPNVLAMIADLQPHVFDLAQDLAPGDHIVELYKRSEMQTGVTQFLGFDLHGGLALRAPPRKARHIEAMADSYGTGYGIEQLNAPDLKCLPVDHAGHWQNFRLAWPEVLAARFDAETEGTVYSGKGLKRGIWPTDTDGLVEYYNRSNPNPELANNPPLFDLSSWVPDVIVLAQGTVDNGMGDFYGVYRDFVVNQLRARAPNAHIFLVVPGRVAREKFIATVNGVAAERAAAGDAKVYPVIPREEEPEEMTACGYHGSPAYHQRVAKEIGDVVAAKTGW